MGCFSSLLFCRNQKSEPMGHGIILSRWGMVLLVSWVALGWVGISLKVSRCIRGYTPQGVPCLLILGICAFFLTLNPSIYFESRRTLSNLYSVVCTATYNFAYSYSSSSGPVTELVHLPSQQLWGSVRPSVRPSAAGVVNGPSEILRLLTADKKGASLSAPRT